MAHCRAYFIGEGGHFIKAKDVIELDDRTAIIAARVDLMHAIELWEREREHAYSVRAGSVSPRMEVIGGGQQA